MTNSMIILTNQIELAKEGKLEYTGRVLKALLPDGTETEIKEIEPIHTYNGWKARGYQVRKGEKANIKFPIWKYTKKKKKDMEEEEAQAKGFCFMKMSAWFTKAQVEPINKETGGTVKTLHKDSGSVYDVYSSNFDAELYDMLD